MDHPYDYLHDTGGLIVGYSAPLRKSLAIPEKIDVSSISLGTLRETLVEGSSFILYRNIDLAEQATLDVLKSYIGKTGILFHCTDSKELPNRFLSEVPNIHIGWADVQREFPAYADIKIKVDPDADIALQEILTWQTAWECLPSKDRVALELGKWLQRWKSLSIEVQKSIANWILLNKLISNDKVKAETLEKLCWNTSLSTLVSYLHAI